MWEFPLHIMDGYIIHNNLEQAKQKTIVVLREAEKNNYRILFFYFMMINLMKTHTLLIKLFMNGV